LIAIDRDSRQARIVVASKLDARGLFRFDELRDVLDDAVQIDLFGSRRSTGSEDAVDERGEAVGILGDRVLGKDKAVACEFFGDAANFPQGPLLVPVLFHVPVVLFFGLYLGGNRYAIHFERFACDAAPAGRNERAAQLAPCIARYAQRLEHYCRLAPYNWFNFYDFWEAPSA